MFLIGPYSFPAGTLMAALQRLGLTSNLQVCLDAGAAASYDGSSQTWTDLSGNGNHFYRGSGSGSDGADPSFNGTSGNQTVSEYFGYDGGDRFTLAQSAPSWQSGMHKAGGAFTILQWAYVGNLTGLAPSQAGFGCGDTASASAGAAINFTSSGSTQNALSVAVDNATPSLVVGAKSTMLLTNNAWQMIATAVTVDSGAILFAINGTSETPSNVGGASVSSNDSARSLAIGAAGPDGFSSAINGCRIAATAIYTTALSAANLLSIFNATRSRFGV